MPQFTPRLGRFAILVVALSLGGAALPAAVHAWRGQTGDFTHFWHAAQAMLHHGDIYASTAGRYVYPPLLAFLFQPLALLPERFAAMVWLGASLCFVVVALVVIARELVREKELESPFVFVIVAAALILNFDKVRSLFNLGQTDGLILLGFAAVLMVDRRPLLAGIAAGAAGNVKYLSLIVVPYLLLTKRFKAAFAAIISFAVLLFLPALEVGWSRQLDYLHAAFGGVAHMFATGAASGGADIFDVTWNRSVSLTSTVFRMTRTHSLGDPVAIAILLFFFLFVVASLAVLRRRFDLALDWASLICLALLFSPQTTVRHFVLITAVYEVAIVLLLVLKRTSGRWILAAAIAVMIAGLTLPFGTRTSVAVWRWREMGGPSWCTLIFLLVLNWTGRKAVAAPNRASTPTPDPSLHSPL